MDVAYRSQDNMAAIASCALTMQVCIVLVFLQPEAYLRFSIQLVLKRPVA